MTSFSYKVVVGVLLGSLWFLEEGWLDLDPLPPGGAAALALVATIQAEEIESRNAREHHSAQTN